MEVQICTPFHIVRAAPELQHWCLEVLIFWSVLACASQILGLQRRKAPAETCLHCSGSSKIHMMALPAFAFFIRYRASDQL
jgi:hypothetical protein